MKTLDADGKATKFSIAVRTFNKFSKTGGKLNTYPVAKLVMKEENPHTHTIDSLRRAPKKPVERRNPNHFENKTRNIKLPNGTIKKINIRFIISFNGKKVIY